MDTQLLAKLQVLRQMVERLNSDASNPTVYSCLLQIVNILDEMYVEKNGE